MRRGSRMRICGGEAVQIDLGADQTRLIVEAERRFEGHNVTGTRETENKGRREEKR